MNDIRLGISQSRGYEEAQLSRTKAYRCCFVKCKLELKSYYQTTINARRQIKTVEEIIQKLEDKKTQLLKDDGKVFDVVTISNLKEELSTHHATLRGLEEFVATMQGKIKHLESVVFDLVELGDDYLSTHQKIQLLGGGVKQAQEIIKFYLEHDKDATVETVSFMKLVMHHTEYQWNKQRERDWVDCEIWEMPVFEACMNEMMRRMHDYEEQTGRCFMTEFLEDHAKEQGKKVVQTPTEYGTLMTLEDDINAKYECDGKVITLNTTKA